MARLEDEGGLSNIRVAIKVIAKPAPTHRSGRVLNKRYYPQLKESS